MKSETELLREAVAEAERILWKISGRSGADKFAREAGLEISPGQILARAWLEKYATRPVWEHGPKH